MTTCGAHIGRNVSVVDGSKFAGRDQYNIDLLGDNRTKQYEAVIVAIRKGTKDSAKLFFVGFDLSGRNLIGFQLENAELSNTDLNNAKLARANLTRADLIGADLSGANLIGANLTHANLINASLIGANLLDANLTHANLRYADLTGANLYLANLSDADLTDANLFHRVEHGFLDEGDLVGAKYNSRTTWPKGFNPNNHGAILIEGG